MSTISLLPRLSPDYRVSDITRSLLPAPRTAVRRLEERIARMSGQQEAIAFRYGRSGLYFLLRALGARGKRVVLPAYTCVVVAHAVKLSGNEPVFVDNAPGSLHPTQEMLLGAMDHRTALVLPTHLFGIPFETEWLVSKAQALHPSALVIQDCAHSFFCEDRQGRLVSSLGDGALFGMNISKLVNSVHGGALALRDPRLAQEVRRCASVESERRRVLSGLSARAYAVAASLAFTPAGYRLVSRLSRSTRLLDKEVRYYRPDRIDLPRDFRRPLGAFEAEMGLRSLERLPGRVDVRRKIASAYRSALEGVPGVVLSPAVSGATWSHYPVLVPAEARDGLKARLERETGCEIGTIVDYSVPGLPAYGSLRYRNAESAAARVLNLPLTFSEGLFRGDWRVGVSRVTSALLGALREEASREKLAA